MTLPRLDASMARPQVVRVNGPIILDFGNGMRLQLSPIGSTGAAFSLGKRGRKSSPATAALVEALEADAAARRQRDRAHYLKILQDAGHKGGEASAGIILRREATRAFGKPLGRGSKRGRKKAGRRGGGRQASPWTADLREKLQADKAGEGLRDAAYYTRWLVDKSNVGLKRVRPVVYRELRAAKS